MFLASKSQYWKKYMSLLDFSFYRPQRNQVSQQVLDKNLT